MITVLLQEEPNNTRKPQFGGSTKDKFFDDFEVVDKEEVSSGWGGKGSSRLDEICAPSSSSSNKSAWEQVDPHDESLITLKIRNSKCLL